MLIGEGATFVKSRAFANQGGNLEAITKSIEGLFSCDPPFVGLLPVSIQLKAIESMRLRNTTKFLI